MRWFGPSWRAPVCAPEDHVETPVGFACGWCEETIVEGDRGVLTNLYPLHIECFIRTVVGSVEHIEGRCPCFGGTADEGPRTRENARRAVLASRAAKARGALPS